MPNKYQDIMQLTQLNCLIMYHHIAEVTMVKYLTITMRNCKKNTKQSIMNLGT